METTSPRKRSSHATAFFPSPIHHHTDLHQSASPTAGMGCGRFWEMQLPPPLFGYLFWADNGGCQFWGAHSLPSNPPPDYRDLNVVSKQLCFLSSCTK